MADHSEVGERLPLPAGLPAPWVSPDDAARHWVRDRVHAPHQMTVLDYDFFSRFVDAGLTFAFKEYSLPFSYRSRRFWTRYYIEFDAGGIDPENVPANLVLDTVANDLGARWIESWLPEIQTFSEHLFGLDLDAATDEELAHHLDGAVRRLRRAWELHFEAGEASGRAIDWYVRLFTELFEGSTSVDAARLLVGLPNMTTAAGHALWRLRELVASIPAVSMALTAPGTAEVLDALDAAPEAAPFVEAFESYLHDYCRRPPYMTLCEKTMQEDPTGVIAQLKDALAHPERDPEQHRLALITERDQAVAAARAALEHHPRPVRDEFERLLALARSAYQFKEDHSFYIDFQLGAAFRRLPVEIGRRLAAAGAIAVEEDFAHLTIDELKASLEARPYTDRRDVVAERRAEMEQFASSDVPTEIGVRPPTAAPSAPPPPPSEAGVLRGVAVSAGTGRGRARVVKDLLEARELRPGEVLVAPSTAQPWTPLFATAAGLVTETGGVLSHAAIVAREYRLPAVARVRDALTALRTGMLLEVDGTAGTVRIVDEN